MPYKDISELPESIRKVLPQHALDIFLKAFNSAFGEYDGDEGKSFSVAWEAVKKSYEKGADGKWTAIKNAIILNSEMTNTEHDAVLQTLDRNYRVEGIGDVYYAADIFRKTADLWNNIPVIFANDHPDAKLFSKNPEQALKDVKGTVVGRITVPRVDMTGRAKLMGKLSIENPLVDSLIASGKVSHSTGFIGSVDEKGNLVDIIPNHLLLFMEDEKNQPRDKGALILNKADPKKPYGDVEYADPGYQSDGVYRYPIDTEEHVRAAWSYINMPKNAEKYTADQLALIKGRIKSAAKKYNIQIQETNMENAGAGTGGQGGTGDIASIRSDIRSNLEKLQDYQVVKMFDMMKRMLKMTDSMRNQENDMADPTQDDMKAMLAFMKGHPDMVDEDMKAMMKGMLGMTAGGATYQGDDAQVKNMEEIKTLKGENERLKAKLTVFEQKEKETRWQSVKKAIPVGMTHKAEDEAALRTEFETDPSGFAVKLAEFKLTQGTGQEGKEFQNQASGKKDEVDEYLEGESGIVLSVKEA